MIASGYFAMTEDVKIGYLDGLLGNVQNCAGAEDPEGYKSAYKEGAELRATLHNHDELLKGKAGTVEEL
jgi:hypothetical protein